MKKIRLAALLPGVLSLNHLSAALPAHNTDSDAIDDSLKNFIIAPLNTETPLYVAGHRSHRSHSSHSSHRSSSSSGSYSGSSSRSGASSSSPIRSIPSSRYNSDPLGQPSTPDYTTPSNFELKKQQQSERIILIKRIQMSLHILGYYTGQIDGIMGKLTRGAIEKYRGDKGLNAGNIIDAELLNSLGVTAP